MNKRVLKKILLPMLLLLPATYAYSGNVAPCNTIVKLFNKPALAALFPDKQNLNIILTSSTSRNTAGCFVQTNISYTTIMSNLVNQDIGSILVYRMSDSRALYEQDKQAFMQKGQIANLNWQNVMPNVVEGYVSNAMARYKSFNAYLSNGDYVIFIYQDTVTDLIVNPPLSQSFINYINVMAAQVVSILK